MSARRLYDLAGADPDLRFSPYCWRVKLALAHKGLAFETIPWRFTDKQAIAFSGQTLVPVLIDGEATIHDSHAIVEHLETTYPQAPSLFGDARMRALTQFVRHWTEGVLQPAFVRVLAPDIFKRIDPGDQAYFRASREARFGMTLEALAAERAQHVATVQAQLKPLRETLKAQDFLAGETPLYADHIVFGVLQWASLTTSAPLLEPDDPILLWMRRLRETYRIQS